MLVIRIEVNFRLEFKYKHIYSVLSLLSIKIRKLTRDVEADQRQKKQQSFQKLDVNDTIKRLSRSYIDKSKRKLFFIFSICRRQGKSVSAICISSSLTDNLVECVQFGAKVLPKSSRHILFRCLFI